EVVARIVGLDALLEPVREVRVDQPEVREGRDRLQGRDEAAVPEVVAERENRVGQKRLVRGDTGEDLRVLEDELAARFLLDLLGVDRDLDRRLERRNRGRSRGGGRGVQV